MTDFAGDEACAEPLQLLAAEFAVSEKVSSSISKVP